MTERVFFVGYCWGGAGSTWLSHALNAHPEVLALHAPQMPGLDRYDCADTLKALTFAYRNPALGATYRVVGYTHGVWLNWRPEIEKVKHLARQRAFALTRHPVLRIASFLAVRMQNAGRDDEFWLDGYRRTYRQVSNLPGDYESQVFYHACAMTNSIVGELELPLFRLEDLVTDPTALNALLACIDEALAPLPHDLVRMLQARVVHQHASNNGSPEAVYAAWPQHWREAYHTLLSSESERAYRDFGYEMPERASGTYIGARHLTGVGTAPGRSQSDPGWRRT